MWCFSSLVPTAAHSSCASSASDAPARIGPRRSCSLSEKRQVRSLPSAVEADAVAAVAERRRHRVDEAHHAGRAVGEDPVAGSARADPDPGSGTSGKTASMRSRSSRPGTSACSPQRWPCSSGMNSMKRTSKPRSRAKRANDDRLVVVGAADHDAVDAERREAAPRRRRRCPRARRAARRAARASRRWRGRASRGSR